MMRLLITLLLISFTTIGLAEERIHSYHSDIVIDDKGDMTVTGHIGTIQILVISPVHSVLLLPVPSPHLLQHPAHHRAAVVADLLAVAVVGKTGM